ncbi:MAG: preprotein translocase subunit SecE [Oscillospiraceae bacterium]|nr:preprotein translocase subunit SecE [Oscillospiraceae bacterium]
MAKEKKDALNEKEEKEEKKAKKTEKQDKKNKSDKKSDKKSGGIAKWFKDLKIEFHNVTWPKPHTVIVNSGIVLGTIVISSLFVGLLDAGLIELIKFLLQLAGNQ